MNSFIFLLIIFFSILFIVEFFDYKLNKKLNSFMKEVKKCFNSQIELDNDIMDILSILSKNKKNIKEEVLSVGDFVKLISDGSLSEETGHGNFIFTDDNEEPIDWDFIRCACSSISKKYNQDCLCDIDQEHFNMALNRVANYIREWKNDNDATVNGIKWYWENV